MKKVHIYAPVEYLVGHLRYGHFEGDLELTDEEFKKFRKNPVGFINEKKYYFDLDLVVDDYDIDDRGDIESVDWNECRDLSV